MESYISGHRASGIRIGDKVRVIGTCISYAKGWRSGWIEECMNSMVNTFAEVIADNDEGGFTLVNPQFRMNYAFPYFLLEKVEKPTTPLYPEELFTLLELPLTGNVIDRVTELTTNYNTLIHTLGVYTDEAKDEILRLQMVEEKANNLGDIEEKVNHAIDSMEDAISSLKDATSDLENIEF